MAKRPKSKRKGAKRGPKEERLRITGEPAEALKKLFAAKPDYGTSKRKP